MVGSGSVEESTTVGDVVSLFIAASESVPSFVARSVSLMYRVKSHSANKSNPVISQSVVAAVVQAVRLVLFTEH